MTDLPQPSDDRPPRFYANALNIAGGPYDVTMTFLEADPTALPEEYVGPHALTFRATAQVVMALGHAKAMIPLLVQTIAQYEQQHGVIPAPGFEEDSK